MVRAERLTPGPSRPRLLALSLLFSGPVLHSCGDARGPGSPGALETWSIPEDPTVVIGGADEREGYLLHEVVGATRLSDGRIVIANGGSAELKYYDPLGRHLLDAGGRGDGPGEFRFLSGFSPLPGDSVLALSPRGLTRFGPDGRYTGLDPTGSDPPGDWSCRGDGEGLYEYLLPDGSILWAFIAITEPRCPEAGATRPSAVVARFVPGTGELDTIAVVPGPEPSNRFEGAHAYAKDIVFGLAEDRVYVGDTGSDTILSMSFDGDTIAALDVPFEALEVPADAKLVESKDSEWFAGERSMTLTTTYVYPDRYPRFGRLVAAPERRLWVMAYPPVKEPFIHWRLWRPPNDLVVEDGGARWTIVDRDGRPIAELRTPPGFFLFEVGDDYILGLSKDDLERESVELYRLRR